MYNNCQVCGNPIFSADDYGTDADGRFNRDFCSNCYKEGHFYAGDREQGSGDGLPFLGLLAGRGGAPMNNNGFGGIF